MNELLNEFSRSLKLEQGRFSPKTIYQGAKNTHNVDMTDIKQIRRQNLRQVINNSGMTDAEFAQSCGSSPSTFSQILSTKARRSLGDDLARRIEAAHNLPNGYLDTLHREPDQVMEQTAPYYGSSPIQPMHPWDSSTPLDDDEVEVPLYMEVELSAGSGTTHILETNGPKLRFSRSTLRAYGVAPENAACCFSRGDSMGKEVPDGATVGIDLGSTQIYDGEIYAIDHGGLLKVKYLHRLPGGGVRIRSELRDEYPDEDLYGDDLKDLRILGWVFWVSKMRRRRW